MRITSIRLFAAAAGISGILSYGVIATAYTQNMSHIHCEAQFLTGTLHRELTVTANSSTTEDLDLVCPHPSSTDQTGQTVNNIQVFVYDGNDADVVGARLCIHYNDASSFLCGTADETGSASIGYDTLYLDSEAANSPWDDFTIDSDFRFVHVYLPPQDIWSRSSLKGIHFID